jgi:D-3-phosphoglycerate dehydrogenase
MGGRSATMPTTRYRALLTDRAWPDTAIERGILEPAAIELIETADTSEAALAALAADADAIITNWAGVTAAVIRAARRCRVICRTGIGLDNIAVATATERKIPVTNVPDYCVSEVADHALALLLACARNIAFFHARTKRGEYRLQAAPAMPRLAGKRLGLIGLGHIGRNLAGKAHALGLEVIACTASGNAHGTACRMVVLDALLAESDFISLHAPLTPATRHMLSLPQFERMKRTAYLVNTARGGLIDQRALWQALERNLIAGAALDVFDPEPPDLATPLMQHERVIITPHAAFVSVESLIELRTRVGQQVVDALSGRRPENVVNPEVFAAT